MNKLQSFFLISFFQIIIFTSLHSQDFMIQGWYWDYPKVACGATESWANTLNAKAAELGTAGFTYVWLPPSSMASFGACSNGYDPQDLYNLGEYAPYDTTGLGTRADLDALIAALSANGVNSVADVIYNHRDGGAWENNPAVENYVLNYPTCTGATTPYPINGKARYVLPLGGATGNNAGEYFFKFSSASGGAGFDGREYQMYFETNTTGWQNMADQNEMEPNGGGDCGQVFNDANLGVNLLAVEETTSGCNTDEFRINIETTDFNASGDTLYLYMSQINGDGTGIDIRPYGIWYAEGSMDVIGDLKMQTRTDFTNLPSGQGGMNYLNFKPNGISSTCLTGELDFPYFFFDIEEDYATTATTYSDFTEWLWTDVGYRGFRMDAVKHFEVSLLNSILNHLDAEGINPGMLVGEFFDFDPNALKNWVNSINAPAGMNVRVFDFALRAALKDACDAFGYDARNVFNSGIVDAASASGFQAVTFINSHDFREADGSSQPVQNDPMLAYAYILTNNQVGLPSIFYPDYYGVAVPNAPTVNLKTEVNELMQIHQDHILNSSSIDKLSRIGTPYSNAYVGGFDNTTLLFQLSGGIGGGEVIVAINFAGETLNLDHGINMTNLNVGDQMTELTSNAATSSTIIQPGGIMHVEIPARSYAVWTSALVPLPLELTSFDVQLKNNFPLLNWTTASEENVRGFQIERSIDGIQFENVGWINAQNQSINQYAYADKNIIGGKYYYRLKMIDLDESFKYSDVKFIEVLVHDDAVNIYPNPFNEFIFIEKNINNTSIARAELFDVRGSKIMEINLNDAQTKLPLAQLENGIFILKIINANGEIVRVEKLVK